MFNKISAYNWFAHVSYYKRPFELSPQVEGQCDVFRAERFNCGSVCGVEFKVNRLVRAHVWLER